MGNAKIKQVPIYQTNPYIVLATGIAAGIAKDPSHDSVTPDSAVHDGPTYRLTTNAQSRFPDTDTMCHTYAETIILERT